jgi:hypothetical protein
MDSADAPLRTLTSLPHQIRALAEACDGDLELLLELSIQHQAALRLVREVTRIAERARPAPRLRVVR